MSALQSVIYDDIVCTISRVLNNIYEYVRNYYDISTHKRSSSDGRRRAISNGKKDFLPSNIPELLRQNSFFRNSLRPVADQKTWRDTRDRVLYESRAARRSTVTVATYAVLSRVRRKNTILSSSRPGNR